MKTKEEFSIMIPDERYSTERFLGSERHEPFGKYNRDKSVKDGLYVFLTPEDHRGKNGVHGKDGHEFDLYLKKKAQRSWMLFYDKTEEDFIARYGRNYL